MKTFFDANVLLGWILMREPTFANSSKALRETIRLGHAVYSPKEYLNILGAQQ